MARLKKKEMSRHFIYLFLFFQSLCQVCHSLETVESHNQAFIQTDKHLTYIVGDVSSGIPIEVKPGYNELVGSEDILSSAIHLDPPMLDFQEQAVGMPRMEQVIVHNTDGKNNLHLLSISGSTAHFHCSFFQDKIVPPGGNTTFDVVFLARQEGNVENTLYIHTSLGSFKYQVFGVGVPNPYRLRPYLGARVPLNSSFSPLINMHNPHSNTLQVLEMFSSEGDLHLELPTGEKEAPRALWEIPPYETKTIMKANFVARTENNHTAFIRIKTNHRDDRQLLVLPMEVEVSSTPGVYVSQELLDFGIVRTFDEPKTVPINLLNTGDTPVQISSVTVSPPNEAVSVDFRPIKLQAELPRQTTVAYVTFKASKALHPKLWSGKIVIRSKNNVHKITIPYEARVLHGSLTYHKNMTYFFAHMEATNYTRFMEFTNTFNFSLVLYNVTLPPEVKDTFSIINFTKPVILPPQNLVTPFLLKYHPRQKAQHFRTKVTLHTNASTFEIDIIVYNGHYKFIPHRPEKFEGQLDFGTMGVGENKSVLFTLVNDNPIELELLEYSTDMKGATLELLGIEKGNGTVLTRQHNISAINGKQLVIGPYSFAVFSLRLVAPEEEGLYQAEVIILTPYQSTYMPVLVRTSEGSLHAIPERIVFDKVFPGKIPMKVLQVHSTFHDYMELKAVSFQPSDIRFYFFYEHRDDIANNKLVVLEPQTNNTIGRIYYDSKKECRDECYVGLPTFTPAGHQWLLGLHLDRDVADTDHYLYTHFQRRWRQLVDEGRDRVNVTIEIDTSTVQGFLFSASVQHHWPDIIRRCRSLVKFPLTQIGNLSTIDIIVENTGDTPILVQILPLHLYPNPQTIVDLFKHSLPPHFTEYMETDDSDIFVLPELESLNAKPDSTINRFRKYVDDTMAVKSHRGTITTFLNKGVKIKVQVGFKPKDDSLKTSLIIVRNNLTIIDAMVLEGQGGRGEMKLNNKKPGVSTLQFDIAEKHLKNCDKKKHTKNMVPNFTVKRSFTLKNSGELPFYVHGYSINNAQCEGYGFRVLDCDGYEMPPNTSRKIDIAFTPDFTMSRIQRVLTIFTSLGTEFNYTLQATVPPNLLSKCSASLPRPNWEPALYYSIICVMGFILFCILVASYFEADRIFVADILKRKVKICNGTPPYSKDKIFDLKGISATSQNNAAPPVTVKNTIPPHLINKLSPTVTGSLSEIPNGHIEVKTKEPFTTTVINILKSLFARRQSNIKKKVDNNNIEDQTPTVKPVRSSSISDSHVSLQNKSTSDKTGTTQESTIQEKSNSAQSSQPKLALRKQKAAKRSHPEMTTSVEATPTAAGGSTERKQGSRTAGTSAVSAEKKTADSNNTVKDSKTQQQPIMTDTSGLASFGDVRAFDVGKQKGKKKLRSKPERDNLVKDRLNRQNDDKDETSSTTTESSTGEAEEKNLSAREGTPEPQPPPKTKKQKKPRNLEPLIMPHDEDTSEFELTSKSRAYKKIKGQKDVYDGDILKASSLNLELPYNIETKPKPKKKKVSPTIEKDLEKSVKDKQKGDLAELSLQTDQFAQKHSRTLETAAHAGFTPDGLNSSSRSSSYSSIVSSSSGGEGNNGKNKGDKRYPVGFTPFSETIPAPLTPKTPPMAQSTTPTSGPKLRNAWGTPPTASPGVSEPAGFGLQTIQEASRTGNTLTDTQADMFSQPAFSFGTSVTTSAADPSYGFSSSFDQNSSMTMMQRLQRDRRRRIIEYKKRTQKDDWPGFDMPMPTSESLWDTEYNPMDTNNPWSPQPDTPPASNTNGLWNTLTNSANNSWNSLMGIWSSTTHPSPAQDPLNTMATSSAYSQVDNPQIPSTTSSQLTETVPTFNPFSSDIWSPSATATSGWGIPPVHGQNLGHMEEKDN